MGPAGDGLRWSQFAQEAQDLADEIAQVIKYFDFALVATIRKDGTPRMSAVETHLVGDDLVSVMIPNTRKAADLRRDNRVTLQSPITNPGNPGAEYKLRGRAMTIESTEERDTVARAIDSRSGWKPRPTWVFLRILVSDATHTVWVPDGTAVMKRWNLDDRRVEIQNLRLDMESGGYRVS